MLRQFLCLSSLVFAGLLHTACDDVPADHDDNEVSRGAETFPAASATVTGLGVADYAVTREAACSRVALRDADAVELGTLVGCTPGPDEVRLTLVWRGQTTGFAVDTSERPARLTIDRDGQTAVVREGEAAALLDQVRGEWDLARAVFVELDLAPGLLERLDAQVAETQAPLYSEDLAQSLDPAADGGCPNICHQGGCGFFWDQYCHTAPKLDNPGLCQVWLCGCGDC